jgi:thiamine kinase-like enzyme
MKEANHFKYYLRTLKENKPWYYPSPYGIIGRCSKYIVTPIFCTSSISDIDDFIFFYEKCINGERQGYIPKSLTDTDLGKNILDELKNAKFSNYVFCHNALHYKSFVIKDNKLIGIRNWKYAGFYPFEFEDIVAKYLDNIF